jgi:hypothetical protein
MHEEHTIGIITKGDGCRFRPVPQETVDDPDASGDYTEVARVDFVLRQDGFQYSLAIEVDGHDFHEKTKEQAARDKARDRKLTAHGYHIIRFTGSEVYADPIACWAEVMHIANGLSDREGYLAQEIRDRTLEELTRPAVKALAASQDTANGASDGPTESSGSNAEIAAE